MTDRENQRGRTKEVFFFVGIPGISPNLANVGISVTAYSSVQLATLKHRSLIAARPAPDCPSHAAMGLGMSIGLASKIPEPVAAAATKIDNKAHGSFG